MVAGLLPSAVLHRTAMLPGELSWCARTGHADPPPEIATPCRTSGTISSNAYPEAPGVPPNAKVAVSIAAQIARIWCPQLVLIDRSPFQVTPEVAVTSANPRDQSPCAQMSQRISPFFCGSLRYLSSSSSAAPTFRSPE